MSTHADRDEMTALRELAASAEGLKLDLASALENLRLASLKIRELETDLQAKAREVRDITAHRDRLLVEKEQFWGSVVARESRPNEMGKLRGSGGSNA